jgi:hypothetical protein
MIAELTEARRVRIAHGPVMATPTRIKSGDVADRQPIRDVPDAEEQCRVGA